MNNGKLVLIPVQPIGKRRSSAFVDGPNIRGIRELEFDEYPPSAQGIVLRQTRLDRNIGIRDGARIIGLDVVDMSKLENGQWKLSDGDFVAACNAIEESR
jgi:hypothetical protein